ncbi:MAG TPA: hypothetical protein DDZ51_14925 [Planctomycetaceae bacterium]|nr:hypothetical protein [Planctomycetaceae bacterium]
MPTLPEQIRITLGRRDGIREDAMRALADVYSAEVTRVNERLSKAVALLHKGLRSEAIQLASMSPNALDAAAALDFPEYDDWCEILQFLDIPVPTELQRDLAHQIHEAIVETQPLEGILKKHRRLAIARAPLTWRLNTLRAIAKLDPTNPVWGEDIEALESARQRQLNDEIDSAVKTGDIVRIRKLHEELTKSPWRIQPKAAFARKLKEAIVTSEQNAIGEELKRLAPIVHHAFCEFDETAARTAVAQWREMIAKASQAPSAELTDQVEGGIAWLQEIDRETVERAECSAALGNLQSLLDVGANRTQLDAAYNACLRFDNPPPEDLIRRFRDAIEHREILSKRRNRALLSAIFTIALLVVGALFFWQRAAALEGEIKNAETEFAAMLDQNRLADAQAFWERLESEKATIASDLRLVSIHESLKVRVEAEFTRAQQFADYLKLADVEDANDIDPSALAKAEGLAVTEDEKAAAFNVRRRFSQWSQKLDSEQTANLLAMVSKAREQLDHFESLPPDAVISSDLMKVVATLDQLPTANPRANAAAKAQVLATRTRALGIRDALEQRRQRMQVESVAMKRILDAGSLETFAQALIAYKEKLPESQLGQEFSDTVEERSLWDKPEIWNQYAQRLASAIAATINATQAQELDLQLNQVASELPSNPAADHFREVLDRLALYLDRTQRLQEILEGLKETSIADLFTVQDSSGNRYYIYRDHYHKNREQLNRASWNPEIVVDAIGAVKRQQKLTPPYSIHTEPYDTINLLVGQYQTRSASFSQDWDREFLRLIGEVRNRANLDHMLKEMLIQHLAAGACEGSQLLSANLTNPLVVLQQRSSKRANWFDPVPLQDSLDTEVETRVITPIAELYRRLPSVEQVAAQLIAGQYVWAGFLLRDSDGEITTSVKELPGKDGVLIVPVPNSQNPDQADMVPIGKVQNGSVLLEKTISPQSAGRPIFFLAAP